MKEPLYEYQTRSGTYRVWLEKHRYANGREALILMDKNGRVACATVNLVDEPLGHREVHIKTWSENEFMLPFLIKNNLVTDTGKDVVAGYAKARVVILRV